MRVLTYFFNEHDIPLQPLKFLFEIIILAVLSVPKIIVSIIAYVYFPPEPKNVEGKVILITGAGRGNGRELAFRFHGLGAKVACVDKDEAANNETAARIEDEGGVAMAFTADVRDKAQIAAMHEAVRNRMGPVDVLVNNAAVIATTMAANPEDDALISEIVNTDLLGQMRVIREILPSMLERNSGQIVTVSSMASLKGLALNFSYSAAKFAVNGMMESLTNEIKLMKSNVITTTICPYFIANNPQKSNRRIIRFPELPTEVACEMMVDGILRNERIFTIPNHYFYILPLIRLLPEQIQDMIEDIVYTKFEPTLDENKVIQKYTKHAEMTKTETFFALPCLKMGSLPD